MQSCLGIGLGVKHRPGSLDLRIGSEVNRDKEQDRSWQLWVDDTDEVVDSGRKEVLGIPQGTCRTVAASVRSWIDR